MNESGMNTLASLIEDLDPASDRKPAAKPKFYAVRKCDALRAPAIFFHWDDCRFYVNVKENDDPVEYQSFDMLADAARYLSPQPPKKELKTKQVAQKAGAKTTVKDVKPPARTETPSTSTRTAAIGNVVDSPSPNKKSGASTEQTTGSDATNTPITRVAALKNPPPSYEKETAPSHQLLLNSQTKRKGLPLQRTAVKQQPPASAKRTVTSATATIVNKSVPTSAEKTVKYSKATTVKTPPKKKKSTAKVAKAAAVEKLTMRKSDVKWEEKFQLLNEFKEEFGVMDFLSVRRKNYGKYKGLYTWALYYRIRLKHNLKVDEAKIQRLTDLGLDMKGGLDEDPNLPVAKASPGKREANWEANFRLLNEYKEEFGLSAFSELKQKSTSPGKYKHLYNWIRHQREGLKQYRDNPSVAVKVDETKIQRLKDIGVNMSGTGALTISSTPGVVDWSAGSAMKDGKAQASNTPLITPSTRASPRDRPKRSADDASLPSPGGKKRKDPIPKQNGKTNPSDEVSDVVSKPISKQRHHIQFEKKYELLKEYEEVFGTVEVSTKHKYSPGKFKSLYGWIHYWRLKVEKLDDDPSTKTSDDEIKMQKLIELGVDLRPPQMKLPGLARGAESTRIRAKWECKVSLLAEYKTLYGNCVVPTCRFDRSSKFYRLRSWVYCQRCQIRDYEKDPATSALDEEQYKRLMDLNINEGQVERTESIKTTEHTWEEMFQELERFVQDNGHADVPSAPKTALRNWAIRMRKHYVRMKEGKSSHLTPERIQRMTQLGFSFIPKVERLTFDDRALQWLEYKTKHGCDPPTNDSGNNLGHWVRYIRWKYSLHMKGVKTPLTQERIDKLNAWGFQWESGRYKK